MAKSWAGKLHEPLVVHWIDSTSFEGWNDHEDSEENMETDLSCKSCGFLHYVSDDRLALSLGYQMHFGDIEGDDSVIIIPRVAITKIEKLTTKKK